ncbi:hypothetical protein QVD17_36395 [Tagetes erecta]|uniref:non-specific serine/threonine protein kinase n=1 Tax=Tagetes erecta TaxID=13708 RepID=A0AAD8JUK1_TARER|nr:hypothetical protein QVD17_36395 [Tagetes erecta]
MHKCNVEICLCMFFYIVNSIIIIGYKVLCGHIIFFHSVTTAARKTRPRRRTKRSRNNHNASDEPPEEDETVLLNTKTGSIKEYYTLGRELGHGQYGTTFICTENSTGNQYACKTIPKRRLTTEEDTEHVRREIQIMHHMAGQPNVVSIVDVYEDAVSVYVIMELCAGGELFDRIIELGHYTEKQASDVSRVIVSVVEACHSLGVMHRDLKPEKFLFVNEVKEEEESPLKLIHFGLSVFFQPGEMFYDSVGSAYYIAPEVLRKQYDKECDVWSAGVIIYILLCGVPPFWDETEEGVYEQVLNGELDLESDPWPSISDSAKDLIRGMLARDVTMRMTAHEVLSHPWIQADGVAPNHPLDSAVVSRLKQFAAMNKIKKIAIRVIAMSLSEEEIAGLEEMFKTMDTDDSNQITLEELKAGLERAGVNLKDSEMTKLMDAADIDHNGAIEYGEFIAAMLHSNKVHKEDNLFAAFHYFDKDGSGYITAEELLQACEDFGLGDIPLNEDGRIDYSEFVDMMVENDFGKNIKPTVTGTLVTKKRQTTGIRSFHISKQTLSFIHYYHSALSIFLG